MALDVLRGPNAVASVTNRGSAMVDGVATTQYEISYAPLHVCAPQQAPRILTQRPSRIWIDRDGRLVRVSSTLSFNDRLPRGTKVPAPLDDLLRGPTTTVATITFSEYWMPVRICCTLEDCGPS